MAQMYKRFNNEQIKELLGRCVENKIMRKSWELKRENFFHQPKNLKSNPREYEIGQLERPQKT